MRSFDYHDMQTLLHICSYGMVQDLTRENIDKSDKVLMIHQNFPTKYFH